MQSLPQFQFKITRVKLVGWTLVLHAGGLYALHTGLLGHSAQRVVEVSILSELIQPQSAASSDAPLPALKPPAQANPQAGTQIAPRPTAPPPQTSKRTTTPPLAHDPAETNAPYNANTMTGLSEPTSAAAAPKDTLPSVTPAAAVPSPTATTNNPTSAAALKLPNSNADFLNNPQATYPAVSRRLGETGKVMVRVYVGANGAAQKAEIRTSSGFERLDSAGLAAALKWRYAPGQRAGAPEAMWVNVPVVFTLD